MGFPLGGVGGEAPIKIKRYLELAAVGRTMQCTLNPLPTFYMEPNIQKIIFHQPIYGTTDSMIGGSIVPTP